MSTIRLTGPPMLTWQDWITQFWTWFVANRENLVSLATVFVSLATILAGAIGIPLLYIRTRAADRSARAALEQAKVAAAQARTAAERHEEQTKADRERRITESFAKAVEQLGSEKLETRLGGIYTLERLSRESEREYWPIMEVLTAFVRERAPSPPRQPDQPAEQEKEPDLSRKRIRPAADIQAVLTVLGRREEGMHKQERQKQQHLNLSYTDLGGANLQGAHLEHANLAGAQLEGVILKRANFKDAWLLRANLEDAVLDDSNFEGATFWHANLAGASIYRICKAQTKGADFAGAHFERDGKCANFEDTNLASVKNLTWEQIKNTFGNKNSVPPEGVERPWKWM